ncbi:hypothetical protein L204_100010 [Cryptococcus depauperatus]
MSSRIEQDDDFTKLLEGSGEDSQPFDSINQSSITSNQIKPASSISVLTTTNNMSAYDVLGDIKDTIVRLEKQHSN